MNRRDLLAISPLVGASLPLLSSLALAGGSSELSSDESQQDAGAEDQTTLQFWSSDVRSPETRERSLTASAPARPAFFFYDSKSDTFRYGSEVGDDRLPDKGSLSVILRVDRIRPSA